MITVYGIKNCDTVKKALKWLAAANLPHQLHDYRTDGLDPVWLAKMATVFGWETLVNKKSTTWRNLPDTAKQDLNAERALALLNANPTLIKRPIVSQDAVFLIGFNEAEYAAAFLTEAN